MKVNTIAASLVSRFEEPSATIDSIPLTIGAYFKVKFSYSLYFIIALPCRRCFYVILYL